MKKKKRHAIQVEGTQPFIYTRRDEAYTPPTLSPFRLLLDGSVFFINLHRLCATLFHLLPPATDFPRLRHRLCHLARLLPASTAFRHLARPLAVTVFPSSVSNSVETSTSLAPLLHHQVRVPACEGTFGGRCRLLGAR